MSVAIDVVGTKQSFAVSSSATYTGLTTSGSLSNGCIVAVVNLGSTSVTGVTASWGSQAMTQVINAGGTPGNLFIFVLTGVTSFGNQNLTISWATATTNAFVSAMSFTGVNQASPCPNPNTASGTGTAPSVNITSSSGEYVVASISANSFPPNLNSVSGTQWWIDNTSCAQGANYTTGASSVTMSGVLSASSPWTVVGTDIAAAAGGVTADDRAFQSAIQVVSLW